MKIKVIALIIISLIMALSLLDAPEYVHCSHIGLCEFLEYKGDADIFKNVFDLSLLNLRENEIPSLLLEIIKSHIILNFLLFNSCLLLGVAVIIKYILMQYPLEEKQFIPISKPLPCHRYTLNTSENEILNSIKSSVILS